MYDPTEPRTIESVDGRSVAEVAAIAIGTSVLLVGATTAAFAAAAAVDDDSTMAFAAALAVGIGTIAAGIVAARRIGARLEPIVQRRSAPHVRPRF
ncbi:hypothetical protein [Halosolutus gelatinilyticus]|uniref:hypothetical protein n=1 Tax=Halosolutus gelatinilyticus TaxID=2931975 RepID=UPI001FF30A59|nr:hypothetical protein [Halosolutus gelatinilyticus]